MVTPRGLQCALAIAIVALLAPAATAGGEPLRADETVTLTGERLPALTGADPGAVVAFRFAGGGKGGRWNQIPVQVDERKVVDFGVPPAANGGRRTEGTVYGTRPSGQTALQYADPGTFTGADTDTAFDADDELTFVAGHAGPAAPRGLRPPPATTGAPLRVQVGDPHGGKRAFVYLTRSRGGLDPGAGVDLVAYDFRLTSGDYRTTYRRAKGPNPESSEIRTAAYTGGFSDRWLFDRLAIHAGRAGGADILDGFKFGFGPGVCGRSERTFSDGEGAFVANIDGPVRAIRSYVGANSGPITQRTHIFTQRRHAIITDLRVHPVPGPLVYHDMSPAALGMRFRSSSSAGHFPVDGRPDDVGSTLADWGLWTGRQGSLLVTDRVRSSFDEALFANATSFHLDDLTPPYEQCWGDDAAIGQFGFRSTTPLPNTDPRLGQAETLRGTTTEILAPPGLGPGRAKALAASIDSPLEVHIGE